MSQNSQAILLDMDNLQKQQQERSAQLTNSRPADVEEIDVRNGRIPVGENVDDDIDDKRPTTPRAPASGVDDSFFPPNNETDALKPRNGARPRNPVRPNFNVPVYEDNGFVEINGVLTPVPDVNAYQHKKTLAQGMMDLALLSANANQLRYVLETYRRHPYYYPSLIFISLSIIFQIGVGVGLIWNSRYNVNNQADRCRANRINNYTIIGIFIVTVVNVFISAFGVADPETS